MAKFTITAMLTMDLALGLVGVSLEFEGMDPLALGLVGVSLEFEGMDLALGLVGMSFDFEGLPCFPFLGVLL